MLRIKGYEHTHTNTESLKTTAYPQPKNADKTLFFAKEKPKPNTLVFDLGFTWRREGDSNPRYAYSRMPAFQASAFSRSTISPRLNIVCVFDA